MDNTHQLDIYETYHSKRHQAECSSHSDSNIQKSIDLEALSMQLTYSTTQPYKPCNRFYSASIGGSRTYPMGKVDSSMRCLLDNSSLEDKEELVM